MSILRAPDNPSRNNYCGSADADGDGLASASPSRRRSRLRSFRSCFLDNSGGDAEAVAAALSEVGGALASEAARPGGRFGRWPSRPSNGVAVAATLAVGDDSGGVIANCGLFLRRSCKARGGGNSEDVDVAAAGVAVAEEDSTGRLLSGLTDGRARMTAGGVGLARGEKVAEGDAVVSAAVADAEGSGVTVSSGFGWRRNGVAVAATVADGSGVCVTRAG